MPLVEPESALSVFDPRVAAWFGGRFGRPTEIQAKAWPLVARGEHALVTAPTGSGKTLTAFLWALDRLLTGAWPGGRVRVLYVSPLRALNYDVQRNLLAPLAELEAYFEARGERPSPVRVETRSGDTPGEARRRTLRHPPEILITTPESLNILLTSQSGRGLLESVRCVVLDEIHAVAAGKRGTHLVTAVERLARLAGEFQRIALSATVRPLDRVARFVGGWELVETGEEPRYRPRRVAIVRSVEPKRYELAVCAPPEVGPSAPGPEAPPPRPGGPGEDAANRWEGLILQFKERIRANRSTLLFANSRRTTEKVTRLLNAEEPAELVYSHHGSLSREIRAVVEQRLKEGRLAAIVATSSLELGIDIGALDEVLLVQTPPSVAAAVQRIGRSGHGVGETSRGRLYPIHDRDVLDAAVVAKCVLAQEIEEVEPVAAPLDVLAQVVLSMAAAETWDLDELYGFLRTADPYHELPRRRFDLVLEMLAGRYADSRVRELEPRISIDRIANTVRGRRSAARLVYLSGGTIPDRGYFHLRLQDTMAKIGELDEEFVWERSLGDTFAMGAQTWRIRAITHNDVLVSPAHRGSAMAPFWRAEERDRSFFLSSKIGEFLEAAEETLRLAGGAGRLAERLTGEHRMEPGAARRLVELLERQRAATGRPLPHRRHLLVERVGGSEPGSDRQRMVLHTLWGGRVNRPLAIALAVAWDEESPYPLEIESENDCILLNLPRGFEIERLLQRVRPERIEELLRRRLERTGFFGARFRESAGRALLLPRKDFRRRVPLWLTRQRAKKLLEAVSRYDDFPVLVEAWRTCLQDEFDLEALARVLGELERGAIRVSEAETANPSPFAANLVWKVTNRMMYEDDTPEGPAGTGLRPDLLKELVFSSQLRPRLPADLLDRFRRKLQRVWPGYAPQTADDMLDWLRERLLLPVVEWAELLAAVERDAGGDPEVVERIVGPLAARAVRVSVPGAARDAGSSWAEFVCALESLSRIRTALGLEPEEMTLLSLVDPAESAPPESLAALELLSRPSPLSAPASEAEPQAEADAEEADSPTRLAAEWLRFYGPIPRELLEGAFGLDGEAARELIESLAADGTIVIDRFREGDEDALEICDAENLERLLRILRAAARPEFTALPLERLPQFLASWQSLASPAGGVEGLREALERLFGYPAPAGLWESDLLPARLDPYYPAWLDGLVQESDLLWVGCGGERLTFGLPADLELFRDSTASAPPVPAAAVGADGGEPGAEPTDEGKAAALFPDRPGRFSLEELARDSGLGADEASRRLWELAWRGEASSTSFLTVRQGVLTRFRPPEPAVRRAPRASAGRGRRFERWRSSRAFAGDWFRLQERPLLEDAAEGVDDQDAIDLEELNKDRARILLDRYGVVFRELLARELPAFGWSRLFRTLRIMELSGEVLAGHFFEGVPGLQFASPRAFRALEDGLPDDAIYWMNALDPASPCGLGLEDLRGETPPRVPSTHLVFHGSRRVVVSKRGGRELEIAVAADHPHLPKYLEFLKVQLTRGFRPAREIPIERINGEPATKSPYAPKIAELFAATREPQALRLRRRY